MTNPPESGVKHLIFDMDISDDGRRHLATVVFYPWAVDAYGSVEVQLAKHFSAGEIPSTILLLGFEDVETALAEVAKDPGLERRVAAISRYQDSPDVRTALIQADGTVRVHRLGLSESDVWSKEQSQRLFQAGLTTMFQEHNGLINSSAGYHFIKPSKSHAEFFLRGGNVLMSNREIYFAAAALLGHLPTDEPLDLIYTDTSSINSMALAVADVLDRVRSWARPAVESFGGYEGLTNDAPRPHGTVVVLVSASTSGKLSDEITRTTGIPRERHIYLYYLGPKAAGLSVACDLTAHSDNPGGTLSPIESWERDDCPRCEVGHPTVELIGDNFFPANPALTPRMITTRFAPDWLSPLVESVYGLDVIRCHYSDPAIGLFETDVHLDLSAVLRPKSGPAPQLNSDLRRLLTRSLPAATAVVIHLRDKNSLQLAQVAHEALVERGIDPTELRIINADDLGRIDPLDIPDGVAVVAASAAASARSLLEVSQALRHLHPSGAIAYFVFLARMPSAAQWNEACSNLAFGNSGPNEHPVHALLHAEIPAHERNEQNPWQRERDFWQQAKTEVQFSQTVDQGDPQDAIDERIMTIDAAATGGGLRNNLFLPSTIDGTDVALRLRPNFAFWKFRFEELRTAAPGSGATQAEVYFTIHALLHSMRSSRRTRAASLTRDHIWTVLHPRNFARYNDGIIQAALLRAARPAELNYSTDSELSRDMYRVIRPILFNRRTEEGAACTEVVLALATRHLRLAPGDLKELVNDLELEPDLPALTSYLVAYIAQVLLTE